MVLWYYFNGKDDLKKYSTRKQSNTNAAEIWREQQWENHFFNIHSNQMEGRQKKIGVNYLLSVKYTNQSMPIKNIF